MIRARWLHPFVFSGFVLGAFTLAHAQDSPPATPALPVEDPSGAPTLVFNQGQPPKDVKDAAPKADEPKSAWFTHPKPRVIPRPGFFPIPPTGCGYYSLADHIHGRLRDAPPKSGYPPFALMPPSFFDLDWRYIDDPKRKDAPLHFDPWHRIHIGDNWLFNTGGQAWWRHMHETNSRLTGRDNDYDLYRARLYGDLWYQDVFRFYAELITAQSLNHDLPPLAIDRDRFDFQNLFFDLKIGEINCAPVYVRVGRQELLFGSQRLISPPDWANVRRTFQGVNIFRHTEKFDFNAWWVRPVIPNDRRFNSWDDNQNFAGAWATYRPEKSQAIDLYYLYLDNANTVTSQGIRTAPTLVHTLGSRYVGDKDKKFLWDFEGMVQMGERGGNNIRAAALTGGLGYHWEDMPMNPTAWIYYDWASGDPSPNAGNFNTFNQLFPFGHYYLGWTDLIGRQNIRDINAHLYLYPAKWITFNTQYHAFQLDRARDGLYGIGGQVNRVSLNGSAGGNVGQELDLIFNFHLNARCDLMTGWSKLWAGDFIRNTGSGRSPELFYLMYNVRW